MNLISIYALLRKFELIPKFMSNAQSTMRLTLIIMIISFVNFYYKKRYKKIIAFYDDKELNKVDRVTLLFYVIGSLALLLLIAFFRPGFW